MAHLPTFKIIKGVDAEFDDELITASIRADARLASILQEEQ